MVNRQAVLLAIIWHFQVRFFLHAISIVSCCNKSAIGECVTNRKHMVSPLVCSQRTICLGPKFETILKIQLNTKFSNFSDTFGYNKMLSKMGRYCSIHILRLSFLYWNTLYCLSSDISNLICSCPDNGYHAEYKTAAYCILPTI